MTTLRALGHLTRADLLERGRRYSFLILVGATVYLSYLFVPPPDAPYLMLALGYARGIYNSAWVGAMFGLAITTMVTLIAFYPIKNAVAGDRETQVGQIIAATPVRKPVYVLGKWLSNVALLGILLGVMMVMAVVMQLVRAEDSHVDLWALAVPLWLIAFPTLSLVAAVAVLFECVPFLRGGAGNVVYFFLVIAVLVFSLVSGGESMQPTNDPFGIGYVISDMQQAVLVHDPDYSGDFEIGAEKIDGEPLLFTWPGVAWTARMVLGRLLWVGVAALLALAAALPFDRFDPARARPRRRVRRRGEVPMKDEAQTGDVAPSSQAVSTALGSDGAAPAVSLTPVVARRFRPQFGRVLLAELRLMFNPCRWWWFVVVAGLNIAGLVVQQATWRHYLQALAWLWPILLWSPMGNREQRHNTQQIVFAVPHPVGYQLFAVWLAGVCVAALTGAGFAARIVLDGQWAALPAWFAGALFIPSLALALGTWSGSSRMFEIVYTLLWYLVAINRVAALDYIGITPEAVAAEVWRYYLLATGVLVTLAVLGRWRRTRG